MSAAVATQRRLPRWTVYAMIGLTAGVALILGYVVIEARRGNDAWFRAAANRSGNSRPVVVPPIYDADRAIGYLQTLCDFGPRKTGSPAMVRQQDYLRDFFTARGGQVRDQAFEIRDPESGQAVRVVNLIAQFNSDAAKRYLLAAHYDTRPYPDNDPVDPKGRFVGANDGASGTAALMELSHRLNDLPPSVGVDLVLFDAEELVYDGRRDDYFIGSTYFASRYADAGQDIYTGGVLLDMVGDRDLQLFYERNSLRYAPEITRSIWRQAKRLGARQFVPRARHEVLDDHLPLNKIAGIPTTDLIDFDYPRPGARTYWHTTQDVPENCSGESLVTVVYVLDQWLRDQADEANFQSPSR